MLFVDDTYHYNTDLNNRSYYINSVFSRMAYIIRIYNVKEMDIIFDITFDISREFFEDFYPVFIVFMREQGIKYSLIFHTFDLPPEEYLRLLQEKKEQEEERFKD
jgi:putative ribosome biogenesis GTPase RsgA